MEDTDRRAEIRHYPMRLLKAIQARKHSRRGGSKTEKTDSESESATEKKRENHPSGRGEESSEKSQTEK